jgi:hypothetical protein
MRILHLDVETSPNVGHVWSLFEANISLVQLLVPTRIICVAAKWDGQRGIHFFRVQVDEHGNVDPKSRRAMLAGIHKLMSEADAICTFNGDKFDLPKLAGEFLLEGLAPPPPARSIDLYKTAKKLGFPSAKLAYVADALGVGSKVKHEGHSLWRSCMQGDEKAWARMEAYNKGDVRLQERVYRKLRPLIKNHPNHALYVDSDRPCCPNCGGTRLKSNGLRRTAAQVYRRYLCLKCGAWSRDTKKEHGAVTRRAT